MRTFEEWLKDEKIDEGWKTNLALGGALAAGAMGLGGSDKPESQPAAAAQQSQSFAQKVQNHRNSDTHGDVLGKAKGKEIRHKRNQRNAVQNQSTTFSGAKDFLNQKVQNTSTTSPNAGRFLK